MCVCVCMYDVYFPRMAFSFCYYYWIVQIPWHIYNIIIYIYLHIYFTAVSYNMAHLAINHVMCIENVFIFFPRQKNDDDKRKIDVE